ncbi:MAG: F0F1 ATP synthase subunit delta [Treponema sp.]|jgi:ATP synthase F1 delta subunit|nr:F0F1 ATP synthase subunit delta [Treponema sp.]
MFTPEPWARAFLRAMPSKTAEDDALEILALYCRAGLMVPGEITGLNDARRFAGIIDRSLEKAGSPDVLDAAQYARNFFLLMIRKGCLYQYKKITARIRKIIDEKRGTVQAVLEAPFEPDAGFIESVQQRLLEKTKARKIELDFCLSPELIGGFRIRMGSVLLDGSLKARLAKMAFDFGGERDIKKRGRI